MVDTVRRESYKIVNRLFYWFNRAMNAADTAKNNILSLHFDMHCFIFSSTRTLDEPTKTFYCLNSNVYGYNLSSLHVKCSICPF